MSVYLPDKLRARIEEADQRRCCYCHVTEANSGIRLTHDHIVPRSKGGGTTFENRCLACSACNEHKAGATDAVDPHTAWSADATRLEGLTATGRATVVALRVKHPRLLTARGRWARLGWHPPPDDR